MSARKRLDRKTQQQNEDQGVQGSSSSTSAAPNPVHGFTTRRMIIRLVMVGISMLVTKLYFGDQEPGITTFLSASNIVEKETYDVPCSKDYDKELEMWGDCVPKKCGRVVMDHVVSTAEASHLLRLAKNGLALGGSSGGASILDLHSGALSKDDKFIDVYRHQENLNEKVFSEEDFKIYTRVKNKIHHAIATEFGIQPDKLFLTKPTFFSRMNTKPAITVHDEYWHSHIDKITYGSFHYTSLLYLTEYGKDFTGGRFVFVDADTNRTVEPRAGRLSFFTSGSENLHFVEKVDSGTRYAITVSFTCDPKQAIKDPSLR